MKKTTVIWTILLILLDILLAQQQRSYKIVVNASNPITNISKKELAEIFLKKTRKWDGGEKIFPVDLDEAAETRDDFSREILKKKVPAVKAYWQKQIFTGRGVPPPEKDSDREVLEYVQSREGGIGYIAIGTSLESFDVKVIEVED